MAIDMFLKVEGVTGESKDANHASWIDVLSFNWGAAGQYGGWRWWRCR